MRSIRNPSGKVEFLNKKSFVNKLYLSVFWTTLVFAISGFLITIASVIHDQYIDSLYSGGYFLATVTWSRDNHTWDTLPDEHIQALKRTAGDDSEGRVLGPWVTYSGVRKDENQKHNEADLKGYFFAKYNDRFWGYKIPWLSWNETDLYPIRTSFFALLFFALPASLFMSKKWILWLFRE